MPWGTKYFDQKPDLGEERSLENSDEQVFTDIGRTVDDKFTPKGTLQGNRKHVGIVLRSDISAGLDQMNKEGAKIHVYVQSVHANKPMPFMWFSDAARIKSKGDEKRKGLQKKAFNLQVASDFNDDTSLMEHASKPIAPGTFVHIEYANVVGGVPGKGKILGKVMEGGKEKVLTKTMLMAMAMGDDVSATPSTPSAGISSPVSSPVKMPQAQVNIRNALIKKSTPSPCRKVYKNSSALEKYYNYTGFARIFIENCPDYKKCFATAASFINATSGPGSAQNLLNRKGLGAHFKDLLTKNYHNTPYFYGGKAEFTPEYTYTGGLDKKQAAENNKALAGGYRVKGKSYNEYWRSKGFIKDTPAGTRVLNAFDCLGATPWLSLKSGFMLQPSGWKDSQTLWNGGYRQKYSLPINIEQFAITPGSCASYCGGGRAHLWQSAGNPARPSAKHPGWFEVDVFEASGHFSPNKKHTIKLRYRTGRDKDTIERWPGANSKKICLSVPGTWFYADWTGDFDKDIPQAPISKPKKQTNKYFHGDSHKWTQAKKLAALNPVFRPKVEAVLAGMRRRGFSPTIYYGWRTQAEQNAIVARGHSWVWFSFHLATEGGRPSALAADIVDSKLYWNAKPPFWAALNEEAKKAGLYWGGDWTSKDVAHVQLLPNREIRRIATESGHTGPIKVTSAARAKMKRDLGIA